MNYWKKYLSFDNFILAWRRINTGLNVNYKRFFREAYLTYEVSLSSNIKNLIKRIKNDVYEPHQPDKIFIPKPSGLQRPITLLSIEDQIIWQAIANVLELRWHDRRLKVEKKVVFSNHPNPNKIFFFESWRISYPKFISRVKEIYKKNRWTAHFDLAAFFDTISHDHIINLLTPRSPNSEIAVFTKKALKRWSSEKKPKTFSHGIPQGPIASSYIGELIFFDIDQPMLLAENGFFYLRYVDDVRLFAEEEDKVRKGIVYLEQLCRNKGLIPQSKKTDIFYADTEEKAVGKDFSLLPEEYSVPISDKYLLDSVDKEKNEIIDMPRFKFFLFKAYGFEKHLDLILGLFEKRPDLSDAFVVYLSKFNENKKVVDYLKNLIERKSFPYQYVEGNVWLLLSKIDTKRRSSKLLKEGKSRVLNSKNNFYLRYGLLKYLAPFVMKSERRIFNKYIYENSSILQALLLSDARIYFDYGNYIRILKQCLIRTKPDAGLAAVARLAYDDIEYSEVRPSKRLKSPVRDSLVSLGLAKSIILPEITPFQEIFLNRYNIDISDWKPYLKREHKHAHRILVLAEKAFDINKISWMCSTDSFNEILVRSLIKLDASITQRLVNQQGNLIPYGSLLNPQNDFSTKYQIIADNFRLVHERRCSLPEAHPYERTTAKRAKFLKTGERNHFYGLLKTAYLELDRAFEYL